jgi:hypothetical protein
MDEINKRVKEFWKNFILKDAVYIIEASRDLPALCMPSVGQILLPHIMNNFIGFDLPLPTGKLKIQCVNLDKAL